MVAPFAHPLFGFGALPDVDALRARADVPAAAVLSRARRLAAARAAARAEVARRIAEAYAPPWGGAVPLLDDEPAWLTASDVVRALIAGDDTEVFEAVLSGLTLAPGFENARARWRREAETVADGTTSVVCEPVYARRWALALWDAPDLRVDVPAVLGSLGAEGGDAFASLSANTREGLWTADEARERMARGLELAHARRWPAMLPLYFDRHGGLAALDAAQRAAPVTLVVAPSDEQGRQSLVYAWLARLRDADAPAPFAGFAIGDAIFNLGRSYAAGDLAEQGITPAARLFALAPGGWRSQGSRGHVGGVGLGSGVGWFDRASPRDLRAALHAAHSAPETYRLVIALTEHEAACLAAVVPETAALPVVRVPAITERDWLGIWLSRLPLLAVPPNGLADVLAAFANATDAERRAWTVDDVAATVGRRRWATPGMHWRRFVRNVRAGTHARGQWPEALHDFAARFAGDLTRLGVLVEGLASFPFGEGR